MKDDADEQQNRPRAQVQSNETPLSTGNKLTSGRLTEPKGVHHFHTSEEFNAWKEKYQPRRQKTPPQQNH